MQKIPPRVLFFGQIYSSILATMTQTGGMSRISLISLDHEANFRHPVLRWMYGNITDLCKPTNTQRFTCNGAKVVYNASLIWGTIGPQRMFQAGQVYNSIMYFFIIGVCHW